MSNSGITIYKYKRFCTSCGTLYTFKSTTAPLKNRPTYICDNCQVTKDVLTGKTCETCRHFNENYRVQGQNKYFRKCALGKVSDQEDVDEDDPNEYGLVYYKDYCKSHEEKE